MIKDATERTHLCDLHARDWSGFQFGIALDYSQSGLFSAGNKTNYFLTKISQFFQSPLSAARVAGFIIETGIGTPLQHQMLQRTYCKQNNKYHEIEKQNILVVLALQLRDVCSGRPGQPTMFTYFNVNQRKATTFPSPSSTAGDDRESHMR